MFSLLVTSSIWHTISIYHSWLTNLTCQLIEIDTNQYIHYVYILTYFIYLQKKYIINNDYNIIIIIVWIILICIYIFILFRYIISIQSTPCKHPVIVLQDVAFTDLNALVEFIYHGEVNVHQRSLSSFLKTAEVLRVSGLTQQQAEETHNVSAF